MNLAVAVIRRQGRFTLDAAFESTGHVTALFGRSGAGKTTLVNLIAGLIRPDAGTIRIGDDVLVDTGRGLFVPVHQRRLGYVFQEGRLFPHLSVRSNLLYGRRRVPGGERWGSLEQIVYLLGIGHLLRRRPTALSGGEKQRVAIGRALLASPRLLLLDEPLAALDASRKAEILPYLDRLRAEMHLPIVYVSHAVEEIARIADTVVMLDEGRVVAAGPVAEVFARLEVASLLGEFDAGALLTVRVAAHEPEAGRSLLAHPAGSLQAPLVDAPPGSAVRLRIRARDVSVAVGEVGRLSIRNRLAATIAELRPARPGSVDLLLDLGGDRLIARLTPDAVDELQLRPGLAVTALIKAVAIEGSAPAAAEPPA